jgi:probable HAF family extracellular repeat protein
MCKPHIIFQDGATMSTTLPPSGPRRAAPLWVLTGALTISGAAWAGKVPQVTDLGGLLPNGFASALAVNQNGVSIGIAERPSDHQTVTALWRKPGRVQALPDCCASGIGMPRAINLGREAVGDFTATKDWNSPVYWSADGQPHALPVVGSHGLGKAYSINDAGLITGSNVEDSGAQVAVIWDRTRSVTRLGTMGEPGPDLRPFHEGHGINANGVVVGAALIGSQLRAFRWTAGVFTDLGPGDATHINDSGFIAGYAPGFIPVTWSAGVMSYLPGRDGRKRAYGHLVLGLNNLGDMVGYAPAPNPGVHTIAVLWKGRQVITLGHYPGGTHSVATGITDTGLMVGYGNLVDGGPMHALQWKLVKGVAQVSLRE